MRELFVEGPIELESRIHYRPLGDLSDFAIERLPWVLNSIRIGNIEELEGLIQKSERLVANLPDVTLERLAKDTKAASVARIDVQFIEIGIAHEGGTPGPFLTSFVDKLSEISERPPVATYEDLVINNPPDDIRTFTVGEVGRAEADFYEGHRRVEGYLDDSIELLLRTVDVLKVRGVTGIRDSVQFLDQVSENIKAVHNLTQVIGYKMDPVLFNAFRRYLNPHPIRNLKGPSGQFTAGIPTIDMLLAGENIPIEVHKYWMEHDIFFPKEGRARMALARQISGGGLSLSSIAKRLGSPEIVVQKLSDISKLVQDFRSIHYGVVNNQIPGALRGDIAGTSGETDVAGFLKTRIKIKHID